MEYGIALLYEGINANDREIIIRSYLKGDIKILVCTVYVSWEIENI